MDTKIRKKSHGDLPATVQLVKEVRNELRADIRSVDAKIASVDAKVASVDAKIASVDAKIASVDAKVDSLEAKIVSVEAKIAPVDARVTSVDAKVDSLEARFVSLEAKMDSRFQQVLAVVHRTQVIVEEQRGENRIVLDGLKTVIDRQERLEQEHAETRRTVQALARSRES